MIGAYCLEGLMGLMVAAAAGAWCYERRCRRRAREAAPRVGLLVMGRGGSCVGVSDNYGHTWEQVLDGDHDAAIRAWCATLPTFDFEAEVWRVKNPPNEPDRPTR